MPKSTPDEREGDFIPASEAHKRGFWGTPVSEFPNEAYQLENIVKKHPGGPVGTDEKPGQDPVPSEPKKGGK